MCLDIIGRQVKWEANPALSRSKSRGMSKQFSHAHETLPVPKHEDAAAGKSRGEGGCVKLPQRAAARLEDLAVFGHDEIRVHFPGRVRPPAVVVHDKAGAIGRHVILAAVIGVRVIHPRPAQFLEPWQVCAGGQAIAGR